jgi:hypothetical protein
MCMAPLAHIAGMPAEELLPWAGSASVALIAWRAWATTRLPDALCRLRRRRSRNRLP